MIGPTAPMSLPVIPIQSIWFPLLAAVDRTVYITFSRPHSSQTWPTLWHLSMPPPSTFSISHHRKHEKRTRREGPWSNYLYFLFPLRDIAKRSQYQTLALQIRHKVLPFSHLNDFFISSLLSLLE
jgi:hypothetical protein